MNADPKITLSLEALCKITIIALLVALLPLPVYLYYLILRILVFFTMLCLFFNKRNLSPVYKIFIVIVTILHNPIIPIHAFRFLWMIINISTILLIYLVMKRFTQD